LADCKFAVALFDFGDVAGGADHAADAALGVMLGDAVLARPAPLAVGGADNGIRLQSASSRPEQSEQPLGDVPAGRPDE
jgi:hypothetical protein